MKTNGNRLLGSAVAAAVWWCFGGVAAMAADPTIVGVWWSPKKDAKIEITEKDGIYSGQIIAGINRLDDKNPNKALRSRELLGAVITKDMKTDGKGKWDGGTFYDPDGGTTYKCKMWLNGTDKLMMRGYVGVSLLGRTETCEKVTGDSPKTHQKGEPKLDYLPTK